MIAMMRIGAHFTESDSGDGTPRAGVAVGGDPAPGVAGGLARVAGIEIVLRCGVLVSLARKGIVFGSTGALPSCGMQVGKGSAGWKPALPQQSVEKPAE